MISNLEIVLFTKYSQLEKNEFEGSSQHYWFNRTTRCYSQWFTISKKKEGKLRYIILVCSLTF